MIALMLVVVLMLCNFLFSYSFGVSPDNSNRVARSIVTKKIEELNVNEFSWTKQWYAVHVDYLADKDRPIRLNLLGNDLVLWHDGKAWNTFEDSCPHRNVPLSEGRIEKTGELMCAYHGWRFDGSGACTDIPQALNKEVKESFLANPKSCAYSYPTQCIDGIIWVWGEKGVPGSDVALEASLKKPRLVAELHDHKYKDRISPYDFSISDVPYGKLF